MTLNLSGTDAAGDLPAVIPNGLRFLDLSHSYLQGIAKNASGWLNLSEGSGWLRFSGSPLDDKTHLGSYRWQDGVPTCYDNGLGANTGRFCQLCVHLHDKPNLDSPCQPCKQSLGKWSWSFRSLVVVLPVIVAFERLCLHFAAA